MNNLIDGEVDISDLKYSEGGDAQSLVLNDLDILFNRTNSIEYVGRTAIYRHRNQKFSFASYLVRLVPHENKLDPEYLNLWLNDEKNQIRVKEFASIGVQQANVNPTNLGTIVLALPKTVMEQKEIVKAILVVKNNLEQYQLKRQKLCSLKIGLRQDLLTGKVRVTSLNKE